MGVFISSSEKQSTDPSRATINYSSFIVICFVPYVDVKAPAALGLDGIHEKSLFDEQLHETVRPGGGGNEIQSMAWK